MEVQILSRKFIKPSTPTPNHLRTLKLSFFDQLAPQAQVPLLYLYPSVGISTSNEKLEKLQKSLSDTLALFYPLSGRFNKKDLIVDCSDQGVPFSEAKVNVTLDEFLSLRPKNLPLLDSYVPWHLVDLNDVNRPMLAIQVTFFECGGLVLCVHACHVKVDGFTAGAFIHAWSTATRLGIGEVGRSSFDLSALFPSRYMSGEIVNLPPVPHGVSLVTKMFVFDAAKIAELKDQLGGTGSGEDKEWKPSKVEVVTSVVWKALILASQARNEGKLRNSVMSLAVNLRGRTALPAPPENLIGNFYAVTPTKFQVEQNSTTELPNHHQLVHLIKESIRTSLSTFAKLSTSNEIFSVVAKFLNQVRKSTLDQEVDVFRFTTMCGFNLYEIDFGWGKPCLVSSVCERMELVVLMDTKCATGIEAWVTLNEPCMLEFQKDPDILGLNSS